MDTRPHMAKIGGYSLDQLLEWCQDDELIDGYDRFEDSVVIIQGGTRRTYRPGSARNYLKGIFTASQRPSSDSDEEYRA